MDTRQGQPEEDDAPNRPPAAPSRTEVVLAGAHKLIAFTEACLLLPALTSNEKASAALTTLTAVRTALQLASSAIEIGKITRR